MLIKRWCWSKSNKTINFTENLNRAEGTTMFFITEKAKETVLDFSEEKLEYYNFILF